MAKPDAQQSISRPPRRDSKPERRCQQARAGLNDGKREGYGGPCPPSGRHCYVHKLYALDTVLPALHPATKARLEQAMQEHILDRCERVGHHQKKR